jgi:hypothetical protein
VCYCVNGCDAVNIVDSMLLTFADRSSDSPFVERVWRSHSERAEEFQSIAASHWNIVVTRLEGRMSLTVRGPETKATMASCAGHGEWFGILFKLGTFMPLMRSSDLRDRNDVTLPNASRRSFWLKGSAWDFPDFENAETFVKRLVQAGLVVADRTVVGAIRGELQNVTMRTEERHVLQVTGLTLGTICQIERARRATLLLKREIPILDWSTPRAIMTKPTSPGRCDDSSGRPLLELPAVNNSCRFYTISSRRRWLRCDCAYEPRHNHAMAGSLSGIMVRISGATGRSVIIAN